MEDDSRERTKATSELYLCNRGKGKRGVGGEMELWGLMNYEIGDASMKERETYIKNPKNYRLTMYISEKPLDGGFW